jgi:hypothetical protein
VDIRNGRLAAVQRERAMSTLVRSIIVAANSKLDPDVVTDTFVRRRWGDGAMDGIGMLLRAASSPATTTGTGWAAEVTQISVALLDALVPISAGANLLRRGMQIDFGRDAAIKLPTIAPGICKFVRAGDPIPVEKFAASGPQITPRKMACIVELTTEMLQSSSAEALTRAALVESVGRGLDQILFDAVAGDDVRPAGLRYNIAGLTPAAPGAASKGQALEDDIVALGSAVGAVASGPLTFICALPQAIALRIRTLDTFKDVVLPSAALAQGMVICIADAALAAAIGGAPQIDASRQVELHRETAPQAIASGGVMVTPIGSTFQVDSVALRLRWEISWQLRNPGAVSWLAGANW